MLQVIRYMFNDPEDKTEIWLIFANQVAIGVCMYITFDPSCL